MILQTFTTIVLHGDNAMADLELVLKCMSLIYLGYGILIVLYVRSNLLAKSVTHVRMNKAMCGFIMACQIQLKNVY